MRLARLVYYTQVAFWASTPLFAGWLAVSWALGESSFAWPGVVLWCVVVGSSGFLTARDYRLMPREGGDSPVEARRRLETSAYPVVLVLACSVPAFQGLPF